MTEVTRYALDAEFLASAEDARDLPAPVYAEVAFAGKSNVGKSSLINALVGQKKLARTSGTPGCTRKLILFRVKLRDGVIDFVDLPGYGYARVGKAERRSWGPMIERFLTSRVGLRAVVVIVDVRRGLTDDDRELLEFLAHHERKAIVVATKIDKLSRAQVAPALAALQKTAGCRVFGFSAHSLAGADALWLALRQSAGLG